MNEENKTVDLEEETEITNAESEAGEAETEKPLKKKEQKTTKTMIIALICGVVILIACALAVAYFSGGFGEEGETFPPLPPDELETLKPEEFDIMEYDEYLALNRNVMYENGAIGGMLTDKNYSNYGEGVELVYEMLGYLISGDVDAYNSIVYDKEDKKDWFSQQQIYDIKITDGGKSVKQDKNGSYTEYVITLRYKIHENNGSYRNNVHSDATRPQYIVINDRTGELLIMDIIDTRG